MKIKVEDQDESYNKGSTGSAGNLNPLSVKIKHEEEQKPVYSSECSIVTEKDTKHLLASCDHDIKCEEISEPGSSNITPAYSGSFTKIKGKQQGEPADDEDILKVESNDLNVSKEEVCSFLEDSGYANVKVFSSKGGKVTCCEVTPTNDVSFLRAKQFKLFCDPKSVEGMYKCVFCEFITPIIDVLKQHISVKHRDSFKYLCAECGKGFQSKIQLYHHTRGLHQLSDKPVSCLKCDHTSTSYRDHYKHQKLMHALKKKCAQCNYVTLSKSGLQRHMRHKHNVSMFLPHKCHVCTKGFPSMSELKIHQRIHSGNRPFKCRLCNYQSSDNSSLRKHFVKKHLKKNGYWCRLCRMRFDTENELNHHKTKHTFRCRFCDFQPTLLSSLKRHEQDQHIDRKCYKCRHCPKKFNTEKEKMEHEQPSESNSSVKCRNLPSRKDPLKSSVKNKSVSGVTAKVPSSKADPHTVLIICDDCNEQFPNKKVLTKHRKYCVFA